MESYLLHMDDALDASEVSYQPFFELHDKTDWLHFLVHENLSNAGRHFQCCMK